MNADSFKHLFLPLGRKMFRTAFAVTGNAEDAEDAVQTALANLWERRERLDAVRSAEAYAIVGARNAALDIVASRRPADSLDALPDRPESDADSPETRERAERVMRLIDSLPEPQRTVLSLRDLEGLSTDEIHAATGLSAANIRVILSRARAAVRKHFKP
ncbi:MAG: sigma-70 family RNA polymerase sigma factor [Muribaculaceae bacterium]|nr:sigma-70 family RNA polymerase sigma factor [Muribaculaceae bacterium]